MTNIELLSKRKLPHSLQIKVRITDLITDDYILTDGTMKYKVLGIVPAKKHEENIWEFYVEEISPAIDEWEFEFNTIEKLLHALYSEETSSKRREMIYCVDVLVRLIKKYHEEQSK